MALPQPPVLATYLRGLADQCELIGNMQAVNSAEVLANILRTLDRIETRMTAIKTGMAEMETTIRARMKTSMYAMETRLGTTMDDMVARMDAL